MPCANCGEFVCPCNVIPDDSAADISPAAPEKNEPTPMDGETLGQFRARAGLPGIDTAAATSIVWRAGHWARLGDEEIARLAALGEPPSPAAASPKPPWNACRCGEVWDGDDIKCPKCGLFLWVSIVDGAPTRDAEVARLTRERDAACRAARAARQQIALSLADIERSDETVLVAHGVIERLKTERAQLAAAVDEAHAALHEAEEAYGESPEVARAHEALHRVGAAERQAEKAGAP